MIRGIGKILEEEWQSNAKALGLTSAEQHVMWIVDSKGVIRVSEIAKIGLWDRSTVMQMIKRLVNKELVILTKDERDLRITYVELTIEGKAKRKKSKHMDYKLFEFIEEVTSEDFMEQLIIFHREINRHFHGEDFVKWVEETSDEAIFTKSKN